jgi:hypothetical protein
MLSNKTPAMTKPANSHDKPSPSDTPTHRPEDNGHKSIVRDEDKDYRSDKPHGGHIDKNQAKDEQPVNPIKKAPAGKAEQEGKVQP